MANNLALTTVYNHYLTSYARGSVSRYDTHKKSELRSIYNSIVKLNKESPLCIVDNSQDSCKFAVGIKESARELHNTIASLGGLDKAQLLNKKAAFSTNEDLVSAQFIGSYEEGMEIPAYDIEVRSLASPQVNLGRFLPSDNLSLAADTYSFDININNLSYEFQYNVNENDTNRILQERLARLISGAGIGVDGDVLEDGRGNSALRLTSSASGNMTGRDAFFTVSDDHTSKASGSVAYLGVGEISRPPANAVFLVNGTERSTVSNRFTLEKLYEITLNGVSSEEGQTASIGLKNDTDSLDENINTLVGGYNTFLQTAAEYTANHPKSAHLVRELKGIANHYQNDLDAIGLELQNDGSIAINRRHFDQSVSDGALEERFSTVKDFAGSILRKTNQISLNPMEYVDKTIVAYKNPGKNFATPYITSAYSGLLFNSYC